MLEKRLNQYLNQVAKYIGLNSLTLASEEGLLIAANCTTPTNEYHAAMTPLAISSETESQQLEESFQQQGLDYSIFNIEGHEQSLFFCASGPSEKVQHPELKPLLQGVSHLMASV